MWLNLSIKQTIYLVVTVLLLLFISFLAGKRSISQNKETITSVKDNKQVDTHTVKTEIEIKKKDGTTQIVTTTDTVRSVIDKKIIYSDTKVSSNYLPKWNISAIVSQDIKHIGLPTYGASMNHTFIGPVTIGGFVLSSGILGLSIGVNF